MYKEMIKEKRQQNKIQILQFSKLDFNKNSDSYVSEAEIVIENVNNKLKFVERK